MKLITSSALALTINMAAPMTPAVGTQSALPTPVASPHAAAKANKPSTPAHKAAKPAAIAAKPVPVAAKPATVVHLAAKPAPQPVHAVTHPAPRPAHAVRDGADQTVSLLNGRSRLLSLEGNLVRVAVSDPAVSDVRVISKHEVLLQAQHPGTTTLFAWTSDGAVHNYNVHVGLDAAAVAHEIHAITGNDALKVDYNGNAFLLSGPARSVAERTTAEKIAASYGAKVVDLIPVPQDGNQIAIDVNVVELSKNANLNLGVEFGSNQAAAGGANNGANYTQGQLDFGESQAGSLSTFSQFDALMARLHALESRGEAKELARPTLVTVDGGKATFLAGGEVPIPVSQALGQTSIDWKQFGVSLQVQPALLPDGRIDLTVNPEVSSLDYSNGLKTGSVQVPAIKTRRAETQVILAPRQTLMLGGLLSSDQTHDYDQLPGIGDLPILGELFKSRSFQEHQTQLAIFVTPRLIKAAAVAPLSPALSKTEQTLLKKTEE
ncbi:MAG TPA: pilus assembly protein N-terminal domain-containing protein [Oscillatoriaceae cyanobacterium]